MRRSSETQQGDGVDGGGTSEEVRRVIADSVTADTRRQDLLVEYARALGPDPELAHLDDAALEQAVRVGAAEIAAATCRWLEHLAELVVRGRWAVDGARTPAYWLSWALGMANSTAREHIRVALRLRECPKIRDRFAAGELSYSKARALTRVATPEVEDMLLEWADAAPAHVLDRIIADARRQQTPTTDASERIDLGVTRHWCEDGTYELRLRVDTAAGLELDQAIDRLLELDEGEAEAEADSTRGGAEASDEHEPRPRASLRHRAADLVVEAISAAVAAAPSDTSGADRHLVVVHTTPAELLAASDSIGGDDAPAEAGDGSACSVLAEEGSAPAGAGSATAQRRTFVHDGRGRVRVMSARTLWRLACAARLDLAVSRDGHPADLGRSRRAPDARLRRLLQARDRTCRFPGCGATLFLHAHHVQHWQDGGPTDLDNLVLLCRFHHTVVHTGWELVPDGPGRWTFHAPHRTRPMPWAQPLGGASAEALVASARAHANDLDPAARARLLQPSHWEGEDGYDHDMTVGVLMERLAVAA